MNIEEHQKQTDKRLSKMEKDMYHGDFFENYQSAKERHVDDEPTAENLEQAERMIKSFKEKYDTNSIKNLNGENVNAYYRDLKAINKIAKKYGLPEVEDLRN